MDIFIRNIPQKTKLKEPFAFVYEAARSPWPFAPAPEIAKCEILEITDEEAQQTEYHGLVSIRDPKVAVRAIQKMNGQALGSTIVEAR